MLICNKEIRQNLKGEFENTKNQISSLHSSVHSNSSSSIKKQQDEELLFNESFEEASKSSSSAMELSAEVDHVSSSRKAKETLPKDLRNENENVKLLQSALKSEQEFRMHFMKKEQRMKLLIEKLLKLISEDSHDFSFMETNNEQTSMKQTKRSFADIGGGSSNARKSYRSDNNTCSTESPKYAKPSDSNLDLDSTYILDYDVHDEKSSTPLMSPEENE